MHKACMRYLETSGETPEAGWRAGVYVLKRCAHLLFPVNFYLISSLTSILFSLYSAIRYTLLRSCCFLKKIKNSLGLIVLLLQAGRLKQGGKSVWFFSVFYFKRDARLNACLNCERQAGNGQAWSRGGRKTKTRNKKGRSQITKTAAFTAPPREGRLMRACNI